MPSYFFEYNQSVSRGGAGKPKPLKMLANFMLASENESGYNK